jgi:UDP-galactopyranose mutase
MVSLKKHPALVCISHLRWDFVYQRPQHLLSRIAKERDVIYFEEPRYHSHNFPAVEVSQPLEGLTRIVPVLPEAIHPQQGRDFQSRILKRYIKSANISAYDLWYYTPMGLTVTNHLSPEVIIFDCMDELSAFLGAPPELRQLEQSLLRQADVVFTGGVSLYESKRLQNPNVHCCPSSIEKDHFYQARNGLAEPDDQRGIPHPRVGFYGVVDERFDKELLAELARLRPEIHFIIVGPIVKIDQGSLPQAPNIHYLGQRDYKDLPAYLAGWDVCMLPFARNSATKFISPTKTPEYLAAGCPVVSTTINDVVRPYGELGLISIADSPREFSEAIDFELQRRSDTTWRKKVDSFLSKTSWDTTWSYMSSAIETARVASARAGSVATRASTATGAIFSASEGHA